MTANRCSKKVKWGAWGRERTCGNPEWKDGFCWTHHPDSVAIRESRSEIRRNRGALNRMLAQVYLVCKDSPEAIERLEKVLKECKKHAKLL